MLLIQVILALFLVFALSRVVLRFQGGQIKFYEFAFWSILFLTAVVVVVLPDRVSQVARVLGIGRGVDLVIYASIVTLFYLVFRVYVLLEDIRHEVTEVVRGFALKEVSQRRRGRGKKG